MAATEDHLPTPPPDLLDYRRQMVAETEAFLNWAWHRADLPRIPRRLVKDGGFTALLRHAGARAAAYHWWQRTLERMNGSNNKS